MKRLLSILALACLLPFTAQATIVDGERQKPTYLTQGFVTDRDVYMINVGTGLFFTQANDWMTCASVGSQPRKVRFEVNSASDYVMLCYCWRGSEDPGGYMSAGWRNVFFDSETQLFVDRASQANYFFAVEQNGETFRLSTSSGNPTYGDYYGAGLYVGLLKNSSSTALSPFVDEDEAYVDWAIVTTEAFDELSVAMDIYNKAQELKSWIDLIEAENGDAGSLKSVYLNEDATMAELQAAIDDARPAYIQALINNAEDKDNVDVTVLLNNPEFEESGMHERYTTGWTTEALPGGNVRTGGTSTNMNFEAWNSAGFDVYQVVSSAPFGVYEVEVHGFYRYLRDDNAWNSYYEAKESGKELEVPVYVYMNNNATPLMNIFDQPVPKGELYLTDTSLLDVPNPPFEDPFGNWYPDDMNNAAIAFENGLYRMSAYGLVARTGDVLRLGVKGVTNQRGDSWAIWDKFHLYYRGFKPEVVKPVLELALSESTELQNYLMGKTEYAALSKAFADAASAIENNDGEAMFNALNALYDAKDPANSSKDIFLAGQVAADTLRLAEAIRLVEGKKLSAAVLANAKNLLEGIVNNAIYENGEINQLKADVTAAIAALNNSVAVYANLNEAIVAVKESVTKKAYQALINEANELLAAAETGYETGSLTDAQAKAQAEALWNKLEALTASIEAYANLAKAIARLQEAIDEVGESATKSTLKKANLRLEASQKLYDEGSIADADIEARIKSIDELIETLTASVRLRQQYDEAISKLEAAVAGAQGNVDDAMMLNAQTVQTVIKTDYEQGNVDDENIPAEIAKIENIVAALQAAPAAYLLASQKLQEIDAANAKLEEALAVIAKAEAIADEASLTSPYLEKVAETISQGRKDIEQLRTDNANLKTKVEALLAALNSLDLTKGGEAVNNIMNELEAINASAISVNAIMLANSVSDEVDEIISDSLATGISALRYVADGNDWYDLTGRKLAGKPVRKGVYICNGKRVAVK